MRSLTNVQVELTLTDQYGTAAPPIQLELTLYYYPPQGDAKDPGTPTELNQSLTVVLQSGKPLVVSQSADPVSDRTVIVEVKATVLK